MIYCVKRLGKEQFLEKAHLYPADITFAADQSPGRGES